MATAVAVPIERDLESVRRSTAIAAGAIGALGVVACSLSLAAPWLRGAHVHLPDLLIHAGVGATYIGAGVVAVVRRPGNRTGFLMAGVGFLWYVQDVGWIDAALPFTLFNTFSSSWEVVLGHLSLAFPSGRLQSRVHRQVIAALYVWTVANNTLRMLFWDPRQDPACGSCPDNVFLVHGDAGVAAAVGNVSTYVTLAILAFVSFLIAQQWRRATRAARHVMRPVLWTVGPAVVYIALRELGDRLDLSPAGVRVVYGFLPAGLALLPLGFLVGLLRTRLSYAQMSSFIPGPGTQVVHGQVRDTLARVLHDPDLELLYWSPSLEGYVDLEGQPRDAAAGAGRTVRLIESEHGPLAAVLVDATALDEPALLASATAMARLALENESLQAEVRSQLVQLRSTTARLVVAGQDARRQIERDLHDGAQQRLLALSLTLGRARARTGPDADAEMRAMLDDAAAELQQTITELRDLARGIHPMLLTQEGLASALRALADRATLPVTVSSPDRRYPETVETTAYYFVSEALTNAARHSEASQVRVELVDGDDVLTVRVSDDGVGGADLDHGGAGSGLTGMRDRVVAAGGSLHVSSPRGRGTTLVARLPCA